MATVSDEFIDVDEVSTSPRGRKPVFDAALLDTIRAIPEGKAARLAKTFGKVAKDDRPAVAATIRKHWSAVYPDVKPRIDFTPEGIPQVRAKA